MKKLLGIAAMALLGLSAPAFAQDDSTKKESTAKKAWKGTKKGVKKAGHKTAEVASKGKAKITDKKSDVWVGPQGQTIYIDDGNKYYWVNGRGKKIYVSESALRAKKN